MNLLYFPSAKSDFLRIEIITSLYRARRWHLFWPPPSLLRFQLFLSPVYHFFSSPDRSTAVYSSATSPAEHVVFCVSTLERSILFRTVLASMSVQLEVLFTAEFFNAFWRSCFRFCRSQLDYIQLRRSSPYCTSWSSIQNCFQCN